MENLKLRTVGWLKGIQEKPDDDNQKENCVEQKRFLPADCVAVPGRRCLRNSAQCGAQSGAKRERKTTQIHRH